MESSRQRRNWVIDAVLFVGFMVCMFLELTGIEMHQWLGVSLTLLAGYHLLVHWRWVVTVGRKFLGRLSGQTRLRYLVDAGLLVGFLLTGISGLVISTWFDLRLSNYPVWSDLHVIASVVTLSMVVLKVGLHWRWIMTVAARHLSANTASPTSGRAPQTALVAATIGRREFLGLMGVVGVAALFAGVNALAGAGVGTAHVRATVKEMDSGMQYFCFAKISAAGGRIDASLDFLAKAHGAGFRDFKRVEKDPDFAKVVLTEQYESLKAGVSTLAHSQPQ